MRHAPATPTTTPATTRGTTRATPSGGQAKQSARTRSSEPATRRGASSAQTRPAACAASPPDCCADAQFTGRRHISRSNAHIRAVRAQAGARSARRCLTQEERRRAAFHRAWETLEQGIALGQCVFLTLTATRVRSDGTRGRDYDTEPTLRSEVWHLLWTRIARRWPEVQAFTVLEWAKRSGVHLHVVVRDASGLSEAWMRMALAHRYPLIDLHLEEVYGGHGLAWYLTKTLSSAKHWAEWGRYNHPTSQSRHWIPRAASSVHIVE